MVLLDVLLEIVLIVLIVIGLFYQTKSKKHQKMWDKEKANLIRIDPAITRAELCELYVEFCEKNCCWVDY
jgi:hypothetical protein